MQRMYRPARIGVILAIMAILLTIYVPALYNMQINETRAAEDETFPQSTTWRVATMAAARGNIYDRNGVLLASGRPTYNIMVDRETFLGASNEGRNDIVRDLIYTAMDEGVRYNDAFPITPGAPFTYITDMTTEQRINLDRYIEFFGDLYEGISASDLLAWMRGHYGIDFMTSITEARIIIGVRYEIELRAIVSNLPPYIFANDVSTEFIPIVEERGLRGVYIDSGYLREYHTSSAAHLLGYIGPIPEGWVESFRDRGYPMDALVGRVGAELVFEEQLRGTNGRQLIRTSDSGAVMDVIQEIEPKPGQHVYLTMDIGLQVAAEDALRMHIDSINMGRKEEYEKITGGAVAVLDVSNGQVLAAASYPSFNRFTLSQNAATLFNDPNMPMFNRAMEGLYSPGSTFKMITGLTALRHGTIERYSPINDVGRYTRYETYQPSCWIHQSVGIGHGELDIVHAIEQSCNYFFIAVSDWIEGGGKGSAEAIAEVALEFGLGRSTGLEIPASSGILATPENKLLLRDEDWWNADTLMTSFGQGMNEFTPIQLANYAATIANGGTLHSLTLLRRIVSPDMSEIIHAHKPEVLNEFEDKDNLRIIKDGMELVTKSRLGTANSIFGDYQVNVAAKTGTVQVETAETNNGVFICYAPAEDPQIAISIVIEKGGSGSEVMDIARMIFDYYFGTEITAFTVPYGELIP